MKRRGVTLIELVITMVIVVLLTASVTQAFIAGINYESGITRSRVAAEARDRIEDRLISLFQHAYLSPDATNTDTFFIGGTEDGAAVSSGNAADVQFTVEGERIPGAVLASTDDSETINSTYGPQGGVAEVALSTTAVGDSGANEGLYIRTQRPSDSEPTQGGFESVLDPSVRSIEFEFWDGEAWQPTWTTATGATKRLPASVRITYTVEGEDETKPRVLVVKVPNSDVTADNPASQTAGGATQ